MNTGYASSDGVRWEGTPSSKPSIRVPFTFSARVSGQQLPPRTSKDDTPDRMRTVEDGEVVQSSTGVLVVSDVMNEDVQVRSLLLQRSKEDAGSLEMRTRGPRKDFNVRSRFQRIGGGSDARKGETAYQKNEETEKLAGEASAWE